MRLLNAKRRSITDKQIIIDDLMKQLNEKTVAIMLLRETLDRKEQECEELRKANDEKNELLAKLGCPTIATARRKVFCLQEQLKRKEQECEELKEYEKSLLNVIDDLQKTKNEWQEKYNDLGQDFDQLKRQHESDKGLITSTGKMNYQLLQEYDKMKQTLAEIKEIAKAESYLSPQSTRLLVHNILQKISEVVE